MVNEPKIYEEGTNVILEADDYNLKVDSNRIIYIKRKDSTIYKSIENAETPHGYDKNMKKRYLYDFWRRIEARREQENEER